jgi:uncharacterized Zn-finger protein
MDNYSCPIQGCSKVYRVQAILTRHLRAIHSESNEYQCDVCYKKLSSGQNLKEHKLLHSKIFPLVCKEIGCGKRFRHGSQFSAHKKIHNFVRIVKNDEIRLNVQGILKKLFNESWFISVKASEISEPLQVIELPPIKSGQEYKIPVL